MLHTFARRLAVVLILVGGSSAAMASTAHAASTYGVTGYDISWPQCGGSRPAPSFAVAVVGVTGGHGFSSNPCLASEYAWSQQAALPSALYVNIDLPSTAPPQGQSGPAGQCATGDVSCYAYNYGYNNARYSLSYAASQGVDARVWWLDVETNNNWQTASAATPAYRTVAPATAASPPAYAYNNNANARSVQGAIDGLAAAGKTVGAYATHYQWNLLVGAGFTPQVPVWYATNVDLATAPGYCDQSLSFTGGPVWMVQYTTGNGFDGDYACTSQPGWEPLTGIHIATVDTAGHGGSAIAINDNRIYVRPSTGSGFGAMVAASTTPFYGSKATLFGHLDGPGLPESAIAVNDQSTFVMKNANGSFGQPQQWSSVPFYGSRATVMADIDGNGIPSLVAINSDSIWVMRVNAQRGGFDSPTLISGAWFFGSRGTFMAVVDGSHRASAVAINDGQVWVMRNDGTGHLQQPAVAANSQFFGTRGVFMADIDGNGVASAVAINDSSIWVERARGDGTFGPPTQLSSEPFYGTWEYLADIDGSGRASAVAVGPAGIWVKQNRGGGLGPPTQWFKSSFYGTH